MKKILIIHSNMELGGAESSLLGLLNSVDYSKISVDLFLYEQKGELFSVIPKEVNIIQEIPQYRAMVSPIAEAFRKGYFGIAFARLRSKIICAINNKRYHYKDYCYIVKQRSHFYCLPYLPQLPGEYDLAIGFIDPHFILAQKVQAKVKAAWFHTDFSRIDIDYKLENVMWNCCDYIVNVSEKCKAEFNKKHPALGKKSIVIENILAENLLIKQACAEDVSDELLDDNSIKILSVGRFSHAKNFDNVPYICKHIIEAGINCKWYLIGFGGEEPLIREKIKEAGMQERVILLGKKENPYPYLKACDIYIQPSRYEGKCVAVREAQILHKPVVITNYATACSQLRDGYDGVIVPMDNKECARGIIRVIRDEDLQKKLIENTKHVDYTNASEIEKIYQLMDDKNED